NIFSMIGIVFLMGLVTKNAILLVDFANQGQRQGMARTEALLAAGQVRLRPILMTTAAMIFGMLPLALGLGEGAEQQSPMGRAIIGGVITSTLLTLVVVPVIYSYLDEWESRWLRRGVRAGPGEA
ncbi:MAG: efflux RND transporter permease subunit, partial [Rubrivivax sp.]